MKLLFPVVVAAVLVAVGGDAAAQTVKLTERFVFQTPVNVTPSQAAGGAVVAGPIKAPAGWQSTRVMRDRGPHAGSDAFVLTGPSTGPAPSCASCTLYQLVGNVPSLPEIDLLGIHYIKVKPERAQAFEKFVADKLHPAVGNLRPDLRLLYYKATAGPNTGSYITIFALTKASRDKYWPNGQDSDDLKAAFTPAIKALATELQTYLVDGSFGTGMTAAVYESKEWADWVVTGKGQ